MAYEAWLTRHGLRGMAYEAWLMSCGKPWKSGVSAPRKVPKISAGFSPRASHHMSTATFSPPLLTQWEL